MDSVGDRRSYEERGAEKHMDEYLRSIGLHRKKIAKDGSCLFRAVAEQVLHCQSFHIQVRAQCVEYLRQNRENYEAFIEGDFEDYLYKLRDPQQWVGEVEINALAMMYKRDFWIFQEPGKAAVNITDKNFKDRLCFLNGNHYDCVYPINRVKNTAVCQSILYELLYDSVCHVDRNLLGVCHRNPKPSDVLIDDCLAPCPSSDESDTEDSYYRSNSQIFFLFLHQCLFPISAQQKMDFCIAAGMQYSVGDRCQVCVLHSGRTGAEAEVVVNPPLLPPGSLRPQRHLEEEYQSSTPGPHRPMQTSVRHPAGEKTFLENTHHHFLRKSDSVPFGLTEKQRLAREEEERNAALVELRFPDDTSFPALGVTTSPSLSSTSRHLICYCKTRSQTKSKTKSRPLSHSPRLPLLLRSAPPLPKSSLSLKLNQSTFPSLKSPSPLLPPRPPFTHRPSPKRVPCPSRAPQSSAPSQPHMEHPNSAPNPNPDLPVPPSPEQPAPQQLQYPFPLHQQLSLYYQDPLYPGFPLGDKGQVVPVPPMSTSQSGDDLPLDMNVLRFFFNLGVKSYSLPMHPPLIYLLPLQQAYSLQARAPSRSPSPLYQHPDAAPAYLPFNPPQPSPPAPLTRAIPQLPTKKPISRTRRLQMRLTPHTRPHKPHSPRKTHPTAHKPLLSLCTAPPTAHKPLLSLCTAPPTAHKPLLSLCTAPPTAHKPLLSLCTAPPTAHKPLLSLCTAPPTAHKPLLSLCTTPPTTHKLLLCLCTAPPTTHKPLCLCTAPPTTHTPLLTLRTTPTTTHKPISLCTAPPTTHKPILSLCIAPPTTHKPLPLPITRPTQKPRPPHTPAQRPNKSLPPPSTPRCQIRNPLPARTARPAPRSRPPATPPARSPTRSTCSGSKVRRTALTIRTAKCITTTNSRSPPTGTRRRG
uniref:ubiquitinyl hydrolase 1 n=1 Tax=Neogobius melanostomus TaxID=47308 RepID=A0A8C6TQY9_9GOBI